MEKVKHYIQKKREERAVSQEKEAKKVVLDELFNDLYNNRKRIYKVNFIRGIFFGVGSALGGTIAIALIVWTLSLFVGFPLIGDLFENAQQSIDQTAEPSE